MSRGVELALRKQRLQFESTGLRRSLATDLAGLAPIAGGMDRLRSGWSWLKTHPQIVVGVAVALLFARPRAALRWTRRGFIAFRAWRALRKRLEG